MVPRADGFGSLSKALNNAKLDSGVVVGSKIKIQISVSWLTIHCCLQDVVSEDLDVQECKFVIFFNFYSEGDVAVQRVDML